MAKVIFGEDSYECSRAVRGVDYIKLYDENNIQIIGFFGISDFSAFTLQEGEWETGISTDIVGANAKVVNGSIQLTLMSPASIETGLTITFKAPCNCSEAENIIIGESVFTMVDAAGDSVLGAYEAFTSGAMVSIILNAEELNAYIQNARATVDGDTIDELTIQNLFTKICQFESVGELSLAAAPYLLLGADNAGKVGGRTLAQVLSDIGAAASQHYHNTSYINSGTFSVNRGGTGRSTLTSGYYLVGNGTNNVTLKSPSSVLSDIGACQIEQGSYNGTSNASNKYAKTLTFSFEPKILIVRIVATTQATPTYSEFMVMQGETVSYIPTATNQTNGGVYVGTMHFTWDSKTVTFTFYEGVNYSAAFNTSGTTYNYLALG